MVNREEFIKDKLINGQLIIDILENAEINFEYSNLDSSINFFRIEICVDVNQKHEKSIIDSLINSPTSNESLETDPFAKSTNNLQDLILRANDPTLNRIFNLTEYKIQKCNLIFDGFPVIKLRMDLCSDQYYNQIKNI